MEDFKNELIERVKYTLESENPPLIIKSKISLRRNITCGIPKQI